MILDIVYLVIGLALILLGANWLTDGSAAIASITKGCTPELLSEAKLLIHILFF